MTEQALRLVAGGGGMPLTRSYVVPRVRPGDRPVPVEAMLNEADVRKLRERAARVNLGADAYIALLAEHRMLVGLVGEERVAQAAVNVDGDARRPAYVATSEFRQWQRLLEGLVRPAADDLPAVYLPLRLAAALSADERVRVVADAIAAPDRDVRQALLFEKTATSCGLTMQTWLLAALVVGAY